MGNATSSQVKVPVDVMSGVRAWVLWVVSAVALVGVVGAPAAASWHGLTRFGVEELGLVGGWELLVPVSLDGAALYAALLAVRAVLAGDSALWARLLTCVYALAAAGFNAHAAVSAPAAVFFGGASVSAVVLFDTTVRALRRDQLRVLGVVQGVSARFRPLRWLLAPEETGQAWRAAVLEGVLDPRVALAMVRGERVGRDGRGTPPEGGTGLVGEPPTVGAVENSPLVLTMGSEAEAAGPSPWAERASAPPVYAGLVPAATPERDTDHRVSDGDGGGVEEHPDWAAHAGHDGLSAPDCAFCPDALEVARERAAVAELAGAETKAEALVVAWRALGVVGDPVTSDVMPAVEWLAARGVMVDRSRAYDVRRKLVARRVARAVRPALIRGGAR